MTTDGVCILNIEYRPHFDVFDALTYADRTRRFSDGSAIVDTIGADAYRDACRDASGPPERIATPEERDVIASFARHFTYRTWRTETTVPSYLEQHPELIAAVEEARKQIPRYFDAVAPLVLEVSADPDCGNLELSLRIPVTGGVDDMLDRLDRMGSEWWYGYQAGFRGHLLIDTEFR